jgi:hypothetical protein
LLLDFCASKLLYGCLEIHANSFNNFLGALMMYDRLENCAKLSRKTTQQPTSIYLPRKDCRDMYEIHTVRPEYDCLPLLENCAKVRLYGLIKFVPYGQNLMLFCFSIFVHIKDCTNLGICVVRPPVNAELLASISMLKSCLGMHALALRNGCSLAA